jgi:hypothetical protein
MYNHSPAYQGLIATAPRQLSSLSLTKFLRTEKKKNEVNKTRQNQASYEQEQNAKTHHDPHDTIHTKVDVRVIGQHDPARAVRECILCHCEAPTPFPTISAPVLMLRRIIAAIIVFIIITINDAVTPALTWRSACTKQIEVKMFECAVVRQEKALM